MIPITKQSKQNKTVDILPFSQSFSTQIVIRIQCKEILHDPRYFSLQIPRD